MARKKEALEFRYYEIPYGEPLLALYGDAWAHPYGYDDHDGISGIIRPDSGNSPGNVHAPGDVRRLRERAFAFPLY